MATWGDFSSLLQLGAGLGIGLSVFRAPIDIRAKNLERELKLQWHVLDGMNEEKSKAKRRTLSDLELDFSQRKMAVDGIQRPFMWATVTVALANLGGLIWGTFHTQDQVSSGMAAVVVFLAAGYYAIVAGALELVARANLGELEGRLRKFNTD